MNFWNFFESIFGELKFQYFFATFTLWNYGVKKIIQFLRSQQTNATKNLNRYCPNLSCELSQKINSFQVYDKKFAKLKLFLTPLIIIYTAVQIIIFRLQFANPYDLISNVNIH